MSTKKLFISYSRMDEAYVSKLVKALRKNGMEVWFDKHIRSGHQWVSTIEREIKASDALVTVLSQSSVVSSNVLYEVSYAISLDKIIAPVKIEECETPMRLARYQYIAITRVMEAGIPQLISDLSYETKKNVRPSGPSVPGPALKRRKRQKQAAEAENC